MIRKYWKYILFCTLIIFIIGELIGRHYGLCNHPIFIESKTYEYNYAPNQDLRIYGNHFLTNEYSMRSKPIDSNKDTTVVLLIGDSVINGGASTDHEKLASSILEKRVSEHFKKHIRVLNISCGSWGPDNAAAYIEKHGTFDADLMILVVNSQDAVDHMTFKKKVGKKKYPDKQPFLAWTRIVQLLSNKIKVTTSKRESTNSIKNDSLNTGFEYFKDLSIGNNVPLLVYLHPTKYEIKKTKSLNNKLAITNFCKKNTIPLFDAIQLGASEHHLRDHIHMNDQGQEFLAVSLLAAITEYDL